MTDFEKFKSYIIEKYPNYRFSWEIFTDLILKHLDQKPYWLDIGAGPNILIEEQPGAEFAVGIDIEKPKKCFRDSNSVFCLSSAYNIPIRNNTFDFITSRYTFEHLKFPGKSIAEIIRVLEPGGTFIMQTTNTKNPLLMLARLISYPLKKIILRRFFKAEPGSTFKTYYKINTPSAIKSLNMSHLIKENLILQELILVEDIFCHSKLLFTISFQMYKLLKLMGANSMMGNMIAVFKKKNSPE